MTNEMTAEEAVKILKEQQAEFNEKWVDYGRVNKAYNKAIQALESQPTDAKETIIKSALKYLVKRQIEEGSVGFAVDNDHDHDCCWDDVLAWIEAQSSEEDIHREREQAYMLGYEEASKKFRTEPCEDCRNCKKWNKCPCGKEGHENGTSIGYSIGECKDYEPCEDCVSREAVIKNIKWWFDKIELNPDILIDSIITLPSVKPKYTDEEIDRAQAVEQAYVDNMVELAVEESKRPKGKWIETPVENDVVSVVFKCSECGMRVVNPYKYCPNCGAEMSGGGDDEET